MEKYSKYAIFDALMNKNKVKLISELLKNGVDVNIKNSYKDTALLLAVDMYHDDIKTFKYILDLFLEYDVDLNCENALGDTPLIRASYSHEDYLMIKLLIVAGADWNIKDINGEDFLDILYKYKKNYYDNIIISFPNKYKKYLIKKDANKYNL